MMMRRSILLIIFLLCFASSAFADLFTISSPAKNATVSGSITVSITSVDASVIRMKLYADGRLKDKCTVASSACSFSLNTTLLSLGLHTLTVYGYDVHNVLALASLPVIVDNSTRTPGATRSPTPTPGPGPTSTGTPSLNTATPGATPSPTPPGACLLNGPVGTADLSDTNACAYAAQATTLIETQSLNVDDGSPAHWNANNQTLTTPNYFYSTAGSNIGSPSSRFADVTGHCANHTTQQLIRYAAAKHHVNEKWAYAQTAIETGQWRNDNPKMHGGSTQPSASGDAGDCYGPDSCGGILPPNTSGLGYSVTDGSGNFIGNVGLTTPTRCASWGIIQSKVDNCEEQTWPMIALSTAWGEDYRWAKWRGCVDGEKSGYFHSQGTGVDYDAAVSRATSDPNGLVGSQGTGTKYLSGETNLDYLGIGCVGTHKSGEWYTGASATYLNDFISTLNAHSWPGGRSCSVVPAPTPTPTPVPPPTGGITPPALVNVQEFQAGAVFGGHTVNGDGVTDDTSALNSAQGTGDVRIHPGHYLISGHILIGSNRHIQCMLSGTNTIVAFLQNPSTTGWQMFDFNSTNNSSIFYCGFRGPNADINTRPNPTGANQPFFIRLTGPNGLNNQFVGNDFNGIGGAVGAINIIANGTQQPPVDGTKIEYNTFEHCGYYAVQIASATNSRVDHNTLNDCSGFVEGNVTSPPSANTGNVISLNHLTFTHGVGTAEPNCGSLLGFCGFDGLTGGASASGLAFNYSGNTVSNNLVDGTNVSTICETTPCAVSGTNPAIYTGNTCTGGCTLNVYQ